MAVVKDEALRGLGWAGWRCKVSLVAALVMLLAVLNPDEPVPGRLAGVLPVGVANWVEHEGRYVNTALQVALPLLTRDVEGLRRLAVIAVVGTLSTHGLKRALDGVHVSGVRLGQRPYSADSRHNMPSGHCSLASSGAVFVCRRYGWKWGWLLWPMAAAVALTRMSLDVHTLAATVAGTALGVLFTWRLSRRN